MKYYLPEFDLTKFPKVFAGQRDRWATATAACFVDSSRILVASFLNKKVYLIKLEGFEILDEITLSHYPDLMDYQDGVIACSCRPDGERVGCVTLLSLEDDQLYYTKDIITNLRQTHGVRLKGNEVYVTNTDDVDTGIWSINVETGSKRKVVQVKHYPKDLYFIGDKTLVVSSSSRPSALGKVTESESILYLFDSEFQEIERIEFFGQTDCIAVKQDKGCITLQAQDSLLFFGLNPLRIIGTEKGFNFPHGVAWEDHLIVTNYGDNSIDII